MLIVEKIKNSGTTALKLNQDMVKQRIRQKMLGLSKESKKKAR